MDQILSMSSWSQTLSNPTILTFLVLKTKKCITKLMEIKKHIISTVYTQYLLPTLPPSLFFHFSCDLSSKPKKSSIQEERYFPFCDLGLGIGIKITEQLKCIFIGFPTKFTQETDRPLKD